MSSAQNSSVKLKPVSGYTKSQIKPFPAPLPSSAISPLPSVRLKGNSPLPPLKIDKSKKINDKTKLIDNNNCDKDKNNNPNDQNEETTSDVVEKIPEVYKKQGTDATYTACTGNSAESTCMCSSYDDTLLSPTSKRSSFLDRRNWITTDRLYELRKRAQDATKQHKTFTIRGCFYSIRKGLIQRGWVEKLDIHRRAPVSGMCQMVLEDLSQQLPQRKPGESRRQHLMKCERNIMSRFLEHIPIDFLWSARREKTDWIDMARNPAMTTNKYHKSPFTTKEGLCTVLRDFHWFFEEGKSETYYPRSYNVWCNDDLAEFIENFRMSACIAMLKYLVDATTKNGFEVTVDENGIVPMSCIHFALNQCKAYIRSSLHYDIDEEPEQLWEHDWDLFLTHHQMVTQENAKIRDSTMDVNAPADKVSPMKSLMSTAEKVLEDIAHYWSQYHLDGYFNIWIVKPSNRCRGRGIHLMNDLKKILNFVNPPVVNKGHYVLQKYIERPLIIHNCKFDIRQWFLVTSVQPLIIWMYKESYLRFSSQEFSLVDFHESVHLTNHAVQKRYKNGERDDRLPKENMWDCHTFQAYLRQIGKADMWSERIYPGMQKALIGTMLASQDTMDRRMNTFELFGADFMVSEDCQPWLIEINSSPDLGASTSVTARLCPQCLEDVVKVVIDYRNDPKASTGEFELIYKQIIPPAPAYLGLNLFLKGTQIMPKSSYTKKEKKELRANSRVREHIHNGGILNGGQPFLMDLLDCVSDKVDRTQRKSSRVKTVMVLKKPTNLDLNSLEDANNRALKSKSPFSVNRQNVVSKLLNEHSMRQQKQTAKANLDMMARRHASCGPRLVTIKSANDENLLQDINDSNNNNNDNKKDFKCIGSKCNLENVPAIIIENSPDDQATEINNNNNGLVTSGIGNKLKPMPHTAASPSAARKPPAIQKLALTKTSKLLSANTKDYQKFVSRNFNLTKLQSGGVTAASINGKLANDSYCSHFFAVGLSLRAWRSKYNKIINKSQKELTHIPISHNFGMHIAKKGKKPMAKYRKQHSKEGVAA